MVESSPTLSGIEAIRRRPGMYVGDTDDGCGLHHLLWEVLSNCCDQIAAGQCTEVQVEILADQSIRVTDNGPGWLDVAIDGVPVLTHAVTQLHTSASLTGHAPHDHAGIHGVGIIVTVALSEFVRIRTCRDGVTRSIETQHGQVNGLEQRISGSGPSGTIVHFRPDPKFFAGQPDWDAGLIDRRVRELSVLLHHANWCVHDQRIREYPKHQPLASLIPGYREAAPQDVLEGSVLIASEHCIVDWALIWRQQYRQASIGFVNWLSVRQGSHIEALQCAMAQVLTKRLGAEQFRRIERQIHLACRIRLSDPRYASPTTETLSRKDLEPALAAQLQDSLQSAMAAQPTWSVLSGQSVRADH